MAVLGVGRVPIGLVAPLRFKWLDSQPDSSNMGPVSIDVRDIFMILTFLRPPGPPKSSNLDFLRCLTIFRGPSGIHQHTIFHNFPWIRGFIDCAGTAHCKSKFLLANPGHIPARIPQRLAKIQLCPARPCWIHCKDLKNSCKSLQVPVKIRPKTR